MDGKELNTKVQERNKTRGFKEVFVQTDTHTDTKSVCVSVCLCVCVHVLYIAQYMTNFMLGKSQYCIFQCLINLFFLSFIFFLLPW